MSKELRIYTDEPEPLEQAVKTMTDYWIDGGNYCDQTVADMRDAIIVLMQRLEQLEQENKQMAEWVEELEKENEKILALLKRCYCYHEHTIDLGLQKPNRLYDSLKLFWNKMCGEGEQ